MNYDNLGKEIIDLVGGENNISSLEHCATRLRFVLKDTDQADNSKINELPKVLLVVEQGGQFQIVIGKDVANVYDAIVKNYSIGQTFAKEENESGKRNIINIIFSYISGTFSPLLPALAGSGMLKALLEILKSLNWINDKGATFAILNATSNAVFYFLPIFIGMSASKKLNVNPYIGGVIAASLLEPSFTNLLKIRRKSNFYRSAFGSY